MRKETIQAFRDMLRRIYAKENYERYCKICKGTSNGDEERIWECCKAFWPNDCLQSTLDIEKYMPNPLLDDGTANDYIKELIDLLDKLGWK